MGALSDDGNMEGAGRNPRHAAAEGEKVVEADLWRGECTLSSLSHDRACCRVAAFNLSKDVMDFHAEKHGDTGKIYGRGAWFIYWR